MGHPRAHYGALATERDGLDETGERAKRMHADPWGATLLKPSAM
jgi:hypothetical protein